MEKSVILKRGKEESLKRFHPWIFSGAIQRINGKPEEGEIVTVYTNDGEFIARGHVQVGSIAVRVLTFEDEPIDQAFWHRRIATAYDLRRSTGWHRAPTTTPTVLYTARATASQASS